MISIAALASAVATLISAVTAWVTLRISVKHHAEKLLKLEESDARFDRRIDKLESWRDRARGAAAAQREDTDRILLPTAEASSDMHRQG